MAISFIPLPPSAFESCARMVKMQSMCKEDDEGCCRGFHVALARDFSSYGGRHLCVLYNLILGNQLQVTVSI